MRHRSWIFLATVLVVMVWLGQARAANFYWKSSTTDLNSISGAASGDRGIVITDAGDVSFWFHNGTAWSEATLGSVDALPDPNTNALLYWNDTSNALDFLIPSSEFTSSSGALSLAALGVAGSKIADLAITNAKIANATIAPGKLDVNADDVGLSYVIDGGGTAITTGLKGFIVAPFTATISAVALVADQSGSIVIDLWNASASIPTVVNTITASDKPTLSSQQYALNTTLTGWSLVVTKGDVIGFNVDSAATVTRVSINIALDR